MRRYRTCAMAVGILLAVAALLRAGETMSAS